MGSSPQDIYTFPEPYLSITGAGGAWTPPVSGLVVDLKESTIPRIILMVDPANARGAKTDSATVTTSDTLSQWLAKAQALAKDPSNQVTFNFGVQSANDPQACRLSGWILVGAGLTAAASGTMALELEIRHPAGYLDRSGVVLGNEMSAIEWLESDADYAGLITGFAKACNQYGLVKRDPPPDAGLASCGVSSTPATDIINAINKATDQLKQRALDIKTYLAWNDAIPAASRYSKLPFGNSCLKGPEGMVILSSSVIQYTLMLNQRSVWSVLVEQMCPEFQLAILPTYWNKTLTLMPYTPWGSPVIGVYDDEISGLNLPGVDPNPIGGVRVFWVQSGASNTQSYYPNSGDDSAALSSTVMYLPKISSDPASKRPLGKIETLPLPFWFEILSRGQATAAQSNAASKDSTLEFFLNTANLSGSSVMNDGVATVPASSAGSSNALAGELTGIAFRTAGQYFLIKFGAQIEASFTTRLMLTTKNSLLPGGYVTPGCVVSVKSRSSGTILFNFYCTKITHTINQTTRQAETQWSGCYARPKGGYPGIVTEGTLNPMYT